MPSCSEELRNNITSFVPDLLSSLLFQLPFFSFFHSCGSDYVAWESFSSGLNFFTKCILFVNMPKFHHTCIIIVPMNLSISIYPGVSDTETISLSDISLISLYVCFIWDQS